MLNNGHETTKKAIKNAIKDLLLKKPLENITILEISEISGINRSTFHRNYKSVQEAYDMLLSEKEKEFYTQLIKDNYKDNKAYRRLYSRIMYMKKYNYIKPSWIEFHEYLEGLKERNNKLIKYLFKYEEEE